MPKFVDSHCHLDHYEDPLTIIQGARQAGIDTLVSICVSEKGFPGVLAIATTYPFVYASVGIHPCEVQQNSKPYPWLVEQALHPKVIGIGETGIDLGKNSPDLADQERSFRAHIEASLATDLPLIVHLRDGEDVFFSIMESYSNHRPRGVMHCFTGSLDCANRVMEWGWKISLSGILTFPNAKVLRETVALLPMSSLLLETDAPWLAPQPFRGKQNQPAYLIETANCLASILNLSLEEVASVSTANFFSLFNKASVSNSSNCN